MTFPKFQSCALLVAVLAVAGCDSGRQSLPKTHVSVVNVAPSYESLIYLREADTRSDQAPTLAFKDAAQFDYDADQFDFNIEWAAPGASSLSVLKTFSETLDAAVNYLFVITEAQGSSTQAVEEITVTYPNLSATSTDAQTLVVHAGTDMPAVDVYLAAPGSVIAGLQPLHTLAFGESAPPHNFASGDYVLTLTTAGDSANVLFTSAPVTLTATQTTAFVIANDAGAGTSPLSVVMLQPTATTALSDTQGAAGLRVLNAAADMGARDTTYDGQPLFSNIAFGTMTPYAPLAAATAIPVVVTPAGNPGVLENTLAITPDPNRLYTAIIAGAPGSITNTLFVDDGRRFAATARLRFVNAAPQFSALDYFIVLVGTDVNELDQFGLPAIGANSVILPTPEISETQTFIPGDFELVLRQNATTNIVARMPIHFDARGLYTVVATNGPDATTATATVIATPP